MFVRCIGLLIALGVQMAFPFSSTGQEQPSSSSVRRGEQPDANPAATMRVAAVQMRSSRDLNDNVTVMKQHIERCARDGARVVVFPECSLSGYFDEKYMKQLTGEALEAGLRQICDTCSQCKVYAIVGMPYRDGDKLFNSAIVIDPAGAVVERYHKIQLAESWPSAGDHLSVFKIDGVPCSIIVCHDERYPELVRLPVLAGARVVFYLSHESGIRNESKLAPYRAQIQARAVENTVYVVQANAPANEDTSGSHGQSRVIAPDGNIVKEATVFGEDVVTATLELSLATGRMAQQSVDRGPLGDWWRKGVEQVRKVSE